MHVYVQTYTPEVRGHQVALSVIVRLICWKQALLLNLKLGWQPVSPSDSPVVTPHGAWACLAFFFYMEFELRSSCIHRRHFYTLGHLSRALGEF